MSSIVETQSIVSVNFTANEVRSLLACINDFPLDKEEYDKSSAHFSRLTERIRKRPDAIVLVGQLAIEYPLMNG